MVNANLLLYRHSTVRPLFTKPPAPRQAPSNATLPPSHLQLLMQANPELDACQAAAFLAQINSGRV